jgi:hypothetical protein
MSGYLATGTGMGVGYGEPVTGKGLLMATTHGYLAIGREADTAGVGAKDTGDKRLLV